MTRAAIACVVVSGMILFRLGYLVRIIGWKGIARELRHMAREVMSS